MSHVLPFKECIGMCGFMHLYCLSESLYCQPILLHKRNLAGIIFSHTDKANPLWFSVHSTLLAGFMGDGPKDDKDTGIWIVTTFAM
jgi:hypothetical protein